MELHKAMPSGPGMPKRNPLLLALAILCLLAAAGGAIYLNLQKSAVEQEKNTLTTDISSLNGEITALEGQKIEAAQTAQQWLEQVNRSEILWSRVITRVQSLLPVDPTTQTPRVQVLSYSGTQDGKLLLSGQTATAQLEPYEYVSELLSVFNNNPYFSQAVIPSITKGETDQGQRFLNFVMSFNYVPEETSAVPAESGTQETSSVPGAETQQTVPKVSRQ